MAIPLKAVVGELHLIGGARQSVTRPTAVLTAPRHAARGRADDTLCILVELRGPESLPYEAVIDRIEATYWRTPGSVTSALRAALVVTNDWLMDRNVPADVNDRVMAGISCAVFRVREADLFIAQAGPAAAYVAHQGTVERFPAREVTPLAMGTSRSVEVRFSHAALSPGDAVLLCDSATAGRVADEAVSSAIVYTDVQAALLNVGKLAGSNDLIALMIEGAPEPQANAAIQAAVEQTALPAPPVESDEPPPAPAAPPLTVKPLARPSAEKIVEAEKSRWLDRMAERASSLRWRKGQEPAPPAQAAAPAEPPPQFESRPQAELAIQGGPPGADRQGGQPAVGPQPEPSSEPPPPSPPEPEPAVEAVPFTRRAREAVAQLHLRARGQAIAGSVRAGSLVALKGLAQLIQRMLPEDVLAGTQGPRVNTALMTLALLIPLMVAVLVATSYTQYSTRETFQARLDSARREAGAAVAAADAPGRRTRWVSSRDQADAALAIFPDSTEARQLYDNAQREIDRLDNVVRVTPSLLWDFHSTGPHRLAVQGGNVFVLDRAAQSMFQLTLNESGDSVTNQDDLKPRIYKTLNVRERQSQNDRQVGDLIDLVWMPQGGARTRTSLLVLDNGGLLNFDLSWNLEWIPLGQGPTPLGARAIAAFGGNLYVLDVAAGQVLRYRPAGDGYGSQAENYFSKPQDLSTVIDLAIDGNVYLLQSDGRVRKYFGGADQPFIATSLTEPIKRPVALSADAEARRGALYIADAGGSGSAGRIVQLNTDGALVRQIRAAGDVFDQLEDVVVDEANNRLFVISGGKLYTARVPSAP
jgi:hypothetical protein